MSSSTQIRQIVPMNSEKPLWHGYGFTAEIIGHAGWLNYRALRSQAFTEWYQVPRA